MSDTGHKLYFYCILIVFFSRICPLFLAKIKDDEEMFISHNLSEESPTPENQNREKVDTSTKKVVL